VTFANAITDIPGISVGHAQNNEGLTGCTVILCPEGTTGGVDQRGGAPGTRETDLLRPMHLVNHVDAILLGGGSAYGLDAASGVMQYLEEMGRGVDVGVARVPIVPAAILFDLAIGKPDNRPDKAMGYQACLNASFNPPAQGNFGAGTGATVGKILGMRQAMKSGIGTASIEIGNGVIVGAIIAVNAFGDIISPSDGKILAGARTLQKGPLKLGSGPVFADTMQLMKNMAGRAILEFASRQNTIIGVVATNARLDKEEVNKVAQMAHNGLAAVVRPAHSMLDGDTIFALATNKKKADVNIVGAYAAQVIMQAIINGVMAAEPADNLPSSSSLTETSVLGSCLDPGSQRE
jgi:L-aminopeptidase/D-esterase-like protein